MARVTNTQLQEELDRLRRENAELKASQTGDLDRLGAENLRLATEAEEARRDAARARAEAEEARSQAATIPVEPLAPPAVRKRRTSRWWTVLSVGLILIGLILAPVAVAGTWVKAQLSDTDAFVATFAPLAEDPAVQDFVANEVVAAIDENVDIAGLTDAVFDGVQELGLPPRASQALDLLRAPATTAVESLIDNLVHRLVSSEAFSDIWAQALRVSHTQLMATLEGNPDAAVTIEGNGDIGVQLGPIVDEVKQRLIDRGITFAANIPAVNRTIVIAQSGSATLIQLLYGVAIAVGTWLPWACLVLLAAGVLAARRRVVALLGASIGLGIVTLILASGVAIGHLIFIAAVSPSVMPADTAAVVYDQLTRYVSSAAVAVAVLAITVAVVTWLAGPFRAPRALRAMVGGWFAAARRSAEGRGITTGRFGEWLYAQRVLLRVLIAIGASAIVLFVRPLTPGLVIWTAVIALVVIGVLELLQRPVAEPVPDTPEVLV